MCYDVSYLTKKAEKYAKHYGAKKDWDILMKKLPPAYHVSGFDEPQLPAATAARRRRLAQLIGKCSRTQGKPNTSR